MNIRADVLRINELTAGSADAATLSEIADNYGITRQAARDNIKKGENKLFEYEEKLGIMKTTLKNEKTIEDILMQINSIQTSYSDKKIAKILENVKKQLSTIA